MSKGYKSAEGSSIFLPLALSPPPRCRRRCRCLPSQRTRHLYLRLVVDGGRGGSADPFGPPAVVVVGEGHAGTQRVLNGFHYHKIGINLMERVLDKGAQVVARKKYFLDSVP